MLGGYGLGTWIATRGEKGEPSSSWRGAVIKTSQLLYKNPSLLAFGVGLLLKSAELPDMVNTILSVIALGSIILALLTMGMRIEQLSGFTISGIIFFGLKQLKERHSMKSL